MLDFGKPDATSGLSLEGYGMRSRRLNRTGGITNSEAIDLGFVPRWNCTTRTESFKPFYGTRVNSALLVQF